MKKRSLMLIMSVTLAVLLIAGGTFAWFTANADPVVNEFTAGTVEIELIDIFDGAPNVNPGDCYSKVIYVENTGTKRAYIRIEADTLFTAADGETILPNNVISYGINSPREEWTYEWWDIFHLFGNVELIPGWTYQDGYFYYDKVVEPGYFTKPLLKCNRICFAGEGMGDEYQGSTLDITIGAEAIQATHGAVQEVWGVSFPTVRTLMNAEPEPAEKLTEADVQSIIADEEAAFEALE